MVFNMFYLNPKHLHRQRRPLFLLCFHGQFFFSVAGKVSNQNMGILVHKHPQYSLPLETPFSNLPFFDFPKYIFWTGHMDQVAV